MSGDLFGHAAPKKAPSTSHRKAVAGSGRELARRSKLAERTRAELIGCKPKVLQARVKKRLASIRAQVAGLGVAFEDIDQSIVGEAEDMLARFDDFAAAVQHSVDWLEQPEGWEPEE